MPIKSGIDSGASFSDLPCWVVNLLYLATVSIAITIAIILCGSHKTVCHNTSVGGLGEVLGAGGAATRAWTRVYYPSFSCCSLLLELQKFSVLNNE